MSKTANTTNFSLGESLRSYISKMNTDEVYFFKQELARGLPDFIESAATRALEAAGALYAEEAEQSITRS